jgi:hypothetical protein
MWGEQERRGQGERCSGGSSVGRVRERGWWASALGTPLLHVLEHWHWAGVLRALGFVPPFTQSPGTIARCQCREHKAPSPETI